MRSRLNLIHQKNTWMLRILALFYSFAFIIHALIRGRFSGSHFGLTLVLFLIAFILIKIPRWSDYTMLMICVLMFIYFYALILNTPHYINFLFMALVPISSLVYHDLRPVLLSSVLYIGSGLYFFWYKGTVMFPNMGQEDWVYIVAFSGFVSLFCVMYTKMLENILQRADLSEDRLQTILDNVSIGTWSYDLHTEKLELSGRLKKMLGLAHHTSITDLSTMYFCIHPDDRKVIMDAQQEMVLWRQTSSKDFRVLNKDGSITWLQNRGRPHFDYKGHLVRLDGVVIDITERKEMEQRIEYLAYHDEMTGLPNRAMLNKKFKEYSQWIRSSLAILFIDLDNFKEVNDTLGHASGDLLLKDVAQKLLAVVREEDTICRLGGDEFVILLTDMDEQSIVTVANRIKHSLSQIQTGHIRVGASIGICVAAEGETLEDMIHRADESMYGVKRGNADVEVRFLDKNHFSEQ
jgi:diguanylate cyclase (GGDEF)-like protein/PAS domain S-box-containing protein